MHTTLIFTRLYWLLLGRLRLAWRRWRHPPYVVIQYFGWETPSPKVCVGVRGIDGMQSVYTYEATAQGEACATMYGHGLAEIMRRRLVDLRDPAITEKLKKAQQ